MIDGQNFFDQAVRNNLTTYDSIRKTATDQVDDYTTSSLLDYNYFKNFYKMIAINLNRSRKKSGKKLKSKSKSEIKIGKKKWYLSNFKTFIKCCSGF